MQEESIFDSAFESAFFVRRKKLMPLFLKVYIWAGIVFGILFGVLLFPTTSDLYKVGDVFYFSSLGLVIIIVGFYILKYVLLLLEVKSAIRWNWWVGGVWNLFLILVFVNATLYLMIIVNIVVSVPYWVMLYKVQYRWEHEGVSGKK